MGASVVHALKTRRRVVRLSAGKQSVSRRVPSSSRTETLAATRAFSCRCHFLRTKMVMSGGNTAVTMVLALLAMSPTIVSSFVYSSTRWSSDREVARRWNSSCRSTGSTTTARSCRASRGCRQELTCGLQITVRIRGKKSREEDYTNQVRAWHLYTCCFWMS